MFCDVDIDIQFTVRQVTRVILMAVGSQFDCQLVMDERNIKHCTTTPFSPRKKTFWKGLQFERKVGYVADHSKNEKYN